MTVALVCMMIAAAAAAAAPVAYEFEADDSAAEWTAAGSAATVAITREAEQVREGQGALLCTYTGTVGAPFSLTKGELDIESARSLSLSLKASGQAPFVLILTEEDGSPYHTFVTCPPGVWRRIALPLSDLQLQDGAEDENDALDADQVRTLVLQELANMGGEFGEIFGAKPGAQWLIVDGLKFGTEEIPSRSRATKGKVTIDDFARPWFQALPVGGAQVSHVPGNETKEPSALGIRFAFSPSGARAWPGVVIPIGHVDLSAATALRLRVKSRGPLLLHVLLEEQDGSRYEVTRTIPEAKGWQARDFSLADLTLDPSRTDENETLDRDQLRVVVIVADVFNALLDEDESGEYALDDIIFLTD